MLQQLNFAAEQQQQENGMRDIFSAEVSRKGRDRGCTHHPSGLVRVNPNCGSVATEIRIPVRPLASGVTTRPRITETRLLCLFLFVESVRAGGSRAKCCFRYEDYVHAAHVCTGIKSDEGIDAMLLLLQHHVCHNPREFDHQSNASHMFTS